MLVSMMLDGWRILAVRPSPSRPPLDRLYIGLDLLDARPHLGRTLGPSLFRICTGIIPAISPHQCSKFFDRARPTTASRLANVVPSRLVVPDHSLRYRIDAPGVGICPPWHL